MRLIEHFIILSPFNPNVVRILGLVPFPFCLRWAGHIGVGVATLGPKRSALQDMLTNLGLEEDTTSEPSSGGLGISLSHHYSPLPSHQASLKAGRDESDVLCKPCA